MPSCILKFLVEIFNLKKNLKNIVASKSTSNKIENNWHNHLINLMRFSKYVQFKNKQAILICSNKKYFDNFLFYFVLNFFV